MNDNVTVHVPTAVMDLTGLEPGGAIDSDAVLKFQAGQLQLAAARIQELEIALGTSVNIAACALKVLSDRGLADGDASDEFRFSRDLSDRMNGANLTLSNDAMGGLVVKFAPRAPDAIQLER
jgi:hypothetical protein